MVVFEAIPFCLISLQTPETQCFVKVSQIHPASEQADSVHAMDKAIPVLVAAKSSSEVGGESFLPFLWGKLMIG